MAWVEKAFRDRQIRVDSLHLHPRFSENAVVRRQMIEGVQAVSRLTRSSQESGKIPLQVFDRSGGANNISWNEYQNLDPPVCAELVLRAKQTNPAPPTPTQPYYGGPPTNNYPPVPQPQYGLPPTPQQHPPTAPPAPAPAAGPPNLQNIITQLDPSGLQKLLATMNNPNQQQSPQTPQMPQHQQPQPPVAPPAGLNPDLMKMLGGLQQQTTPAQGAGYGQPPSAPPQHHDQYAHLMRMLGGSGNAGVQGGAPQSKAGQPDVQDLMAQLTKYKR